MSIETLGQLRAALAAVSHLPDDTLVRGEGEGLEYNVGAYAAEWETVSPDGEHQVYLTEKGKVDVESEADEEDKEGTHFRLLKEPVFVIEVESAG